MTIAKEYYDKWESVLYGLPYSVYNYYINTTDILPDKKEILTSVIGASGDNVFSVVYTPFLNTDDLDLIQIPYDNVRFGKISDVRPEIKVNPDVFRIKDLINPSKFIGEFETYKVNKNIGGKKDWRNEGKLYQYPYNYMLLTDGINDPMVLKPQYCPNVCKVGVKLTISDRCNYGLFIQNYKGDTHGFMESLISGDALELPNTSSAYANWIATSKNQTAQSVQATINQTILNDKIANRNMMLGLTSGVIGGVGSALSGNIGGVINSGLGGVSAYVEKSNTSLQSQLTKQSAIEGALATTKDMRTMPNTLLSQGSNIIYGLRNGDQKVRLYRYGLDEKFAKKIGDYFAMFGYKQNKLMDININSRHYYNYIKTVGINIKTKKIPSNYLNILKNIFDNGVTIWHIDNENVNIGDYSMDNKEV